MHTEQVISFTDMLKAMDIHAADLTMIVSGDLIYFSTKFIGSGFITQSATNAVLDQRGVGDNDKAYQLLSRVKVNYKISSDKQAWAKKFTSLFSAEAAYSDFAKTLHRSAAA